MKFKVLFCNYDQDLGIISLGYIKAMSSHVKIEGIGVREDW